MKKRKSYNQAPRQTQSLSQVQHQPSSFNSKLSSNRSLYQISPRNSIATSKKRSLLPKRKNSRTKLSPKPSYVECKSRESRKASFKSLESLFVLEKRIELSVDDFPWLKKQIVLDEKDESLDSIKAKVDCYDEESNGKWIAAEPNVVLTVSELNLDQDKNLDEELDKEIEPNTKNLEKVKTEPSLLENSEENELPLVSPKSIEVDNISNTMSDNKPEENSGAKSDEGDPKKDGAVKSQKSQVDFSKAIVADQESIHAPDYPMPPGFGEGIPVGYNQNAESLMSCVPVTESETIEKMVAAEERACELRKEIACLKDTVEQLSNKETLTDEDTIALKDAQSEIMERVRELNDITRCLQRTIGLLDPSSVTFAKAFDMLTYPHNKMKCDGTKKSSCVDSCEDLSQPCQQECERFAFPQVDHPEDKLPRLVVCGTTEENFPKLVVADSRPKSRGNKCLENLTGRLSESLCMQEKLVKENAQLEGGKFQLQKELLEKDDAVENLERKMCGMQAELRLLVKENVDLKRKIDCMRQSIAGGNSTQRSTPRYSPSVPTGLSNCATPKRNDLSCKCCGKSHPGSGQDQCGATRSQSPQRSNPAHSCHTTPRLAGGGDDYCSGLRPLDMYHQRNVGGGSNCRQTSPTSRQQRGGAICPGEMEDRLANNARHLGDQLSCLENEVNTMKAELQKVQCERQQLEQQRRMLESAGAGHSTSCVCCNEPPKSFGCKGPEMSFPACDDEPEPPSSCAAQQLRDLREQYARLQDDYKNKLCEVSCLRTNAEQLRRETREAKDERERFEIKLIDAQERLRVCEAERDDLLGSKEQLVEQEQALHVARQRFREAQDELEELRTMIHDQAAQLDDYRNKYLHAQQQVEEQRRQLDLMEMDNARMNENVTLEIGRVKNQFQEKLAELAPLPDILKQTQIKLQDTTQQRILVEHNCEDLSRELLAAKDKIDSMQVQINDLQRELQSLQEEKSTGGGRIDELERRNGELRNDNERLKNAVARCEEQQCVMQKKIEEKQHEIVQLTAMLEQVREDSARQVSRTKERCEAIKKSMQSQISDFEIQLAQCRAAAKTAQKERDEIRQKMQGQIVNLNESLQQAQGRIRSLQGHVDYLKVSYSNVFGPQSQESPTTMGAGQMDSPTPGYDSCDCTY